MLHPVTGLPQGGRGSPVLSHRGRDGLEDVGHSGSGQRRTPQSKDVRGADDFLVTAPAREVFADPVRPALTTFLAARGVRLSPPKPVLSRLAQGWDF